MPAKAKPASPLFLGIDTGGTYTDAVLWSEAGGVAAKAKALTTRHDLAVGISGAVDAVLEKAGVDPAAVKLVSMSTTLATNALVEGQGGRVALVMIGFSEADLARDGLRAALGTDPVIFCAGGHDVHGNAHPLHLEALEAALPELGTSVSGFAVCAYFAVRNPAHEIAARDLIREKTGLPVTASHELSAKLGGPRRALTTLLNARLISMIDRLVAATEGFLKARGIAAPLMVVRGDGALVSAGFARARPIETILSGPAASLVGARHMTGLDNAVVSDIGGTTTDVAVLDKAARGSTRKARPSAASARWSRRSRCAPLASAAIPRSRCRTAGLIPGYSLGRAAWCRWRLPAWRMARRSSARWNASFARPMPAAWTAASPCAPACRIVWRRG